MATHIHTSKRLEGIGEYYFSQKLREIEQLNKAGKSIINLGIGSPDLPPHPDVIKVLQEETAKQHTHAYQSYKGAPVLREAISEWYKKWYDVTLDANTEILPLIGSKEGLVHICMTYLNEGDMALVPNPGYPTYKSAVKLAGGTVVEYKLTEANHYYPDFEELEKADLAKVKLMFVNYPHMPTGQPADVTVFEKLIAFAQQHDILLVHDNPYSFILNDQPVSLLNIKGAKENVLELNSLSKSQNMAGWRVGMLCGSERHIQEVLTFKSNMDSGMFLPVQIAAAKALTLGKEWYSELNEIYANRRTKVFELLDLIGAKYATHQTGMFVWAASPDVAANEEQKHLLGKGGLLSDEILYGANVFITPGGIFGSEGNNYIRISLCAPAERFEQAMERIQQAKK